MGRVIVPLVAAARLIRLDVRGRRVGIDKPLKSDVIDFAVDRRTTGDVT